MSRRLDGLWTRLAPLRRGPFARGAFSSTFHDPRIAARLGIALGLALTICFVTGLASHGAQRGPAWFSHWWPSRPVALYRVTQGLHVLTGLALIPLLLAKLWVVYPKLFQWPPIRGLLHGIERLGLVCLVGGTLFQVTTGVLNVYYWYAFPFPFPPAHYAGAWIAFGGMVMHIGAKWQIARGSLRRPLPSRTNEAGLSRRGFLTVVAGTSATVVAATVGEVFSPLAKVAVLAPRRAGYGPQGVPINHRAGRNVRLAAMSTSYRMRVDGDVTRPLTFTLDDLKALPQHTAQLPITCVEGWSTSARWTGIPVRDLIQMAGADPDVTVTVESLEAHGPYITSTLNHSHVSDHLTLIALELNGEPLHIDHGYPARLIAPNRPGVEQTKWVYRLTVL